MIFSELYSAYYNAVAAVLTAVLRGETDEKTLQETVQKYAFSESILTILPALKTEKWQLLNRDMTTPIQHVPSMPLTLLEKRWLKAVSLDPRIRLFDVSFDSLREVEPLFTPNDYVVFDRYADGDPYFDEGYIARFRMILQAVRERQPLKIESVNRRGQVVEMIISPLRLEYSEKDDKFRLITAGCRYGGVINLARIVSCTPYDGAEFAVCYERDKRSQSVTLKICDERNALERCMLHFAHFEKRAERIDKKHYQVHICYDKSDETELVIRILSFGPLVEVVSPDAFRQLIVARLQNQKGCELF